MYATRPARSILAFVGFAGPEEVHVPTVVLGAEAAGDELTVQALEVLAQIGVTRGEGLKRIQQVRESDPEIETVDEIVRAVFRRK